MNLPHKPLSFEVLCIWLWSGNSTCASILSIIYRPGSKQSAKFFSELSEHLDKFTIALEGLFQIFKLLQRVKDSTHRLGGTLDLLVCDSDLDVLDLNITVVALSGHHLLSCFINLSKVAPTFITRASRNGRDFDIAMFRSEVIAALGVDNSSSWNHASADDLVETYKETITSLLDELSRNRSTGKSFRVRPSNVWFDDDCRAAKRLARLRERNYIKSTLPTDRALWITQLCKYQRLCETQRNLFWSLQIESNSSNLKKMWRSINTVLGRTDRPVQSRNLPLPTSPSSSTRKFRRYAKIQSTPHHRRTLKLKVNGLVSSSR